MAHLTPTLNFGITALSFITANAFADVDGVAALSLTVQPNPNTPNTTFQGSVDVTAGFSVNVGSDSTFFGLWKVGVTDTLFSKTWTLFKKTVGISSPIKRSYHRVFGRSFHPRALLNLRGNNAPTCSVSFPFSLVPIVNSKVVGV